MSRTTLSVEWYNGSLGMVEDIDDEGIYVSLENDELHLVTPEKMG